MADMMKNGRSKGVGAFSRVTLDMQGSPAFQTLPASAIRVLLYATWLNFNTATRKTGRPVFKFTNRTAKEKLGMNPQTFSRAKQELSDKGFLRWERRGGLRGCNGVASEFSLSGDWKSWKPKQGASHASVIGASHIDVTGRSFSGHQKPDTCHADVTALVNKPVT